MDFGSPNVLAILNIGANLGEILALATAMKLIIGAAIVGMKGFGRGKQWLVLGLALMLVGLALPGIANLLVAVNVILAMFITWFFTSLLMIFFWHVWWLPVEIAKTDGKGHGILWFFCLVSWFGGIPLIWWIVAYIACKTRTESAFAAGNAIPPVVTKLYQKITGRTGTQTLGCGVPHIAMAEDELR